MALQLVDDDPGMPVADRRLLFQPIADIRKDPCLLGGVACALGRMPASGEEERSRAVEVFHRASCFVPQVDVFASLTGLTGPSALLHLPWLLSAAEESGIALSRLVLDIQGPFPLSPVSAELVRALDGVRARGVRISLSRAGLSEEGLEMTLESRPDYLRIAGALVTGCASEFYKQAIVESIAELAWKFGASVIAEGVAGKRDLALLRQLGVAYALGPLFSQPLETHALGDRLLRGSLPLELPPMAVARPHDGTAPLPRTAAAQLPRGAGLRQQEHP